MPTTTTPHLTLAFHSVLMPCFAHTFISLLSLLLIVLLQKNWYFVFLLWQSLVFFDFFSIFVLLEQPRRAQHQKNALSIYNSESPVSNAVSQNRTKQNLLAAFLVIFRHTKKKCKREKHKTHDNKKKHSKRGFPLSLSLSFLPCLSSRNHGGKGRTSGGGGPSPADERVPPRQDVRLHLLEPRHRPQLDLVAVVEGHDHVAPEADSVTFFLCIFVCFGCFCSGVWVWKEGKRRRNRRRSESRVFRERERVFFFFFFFFFFGPFPSPTEKKEKNMRRGKKQNKRLTPCPRSRPA